MERTLTAEVQDIKAILLVCKNCGSIQGYNPATWNGALTYGCPNCPKARGWSNETVRPNVEALITSLREIAKVIEDLPFEIRLKFDSLTEK